MSEKAKILFVDDEQQVLIALRALFRSKYEVVLANSAQQALNIISREKIDVIITDQRMPGMTGVNLLKQVKECNPNIIRMLLTGYSDQEAVLNSINEGEIFRFIRKPWDNNQIRHIIDMAVEVAQGKFSIIEQKPKLIASKLPSEEEDIGVLVLDSKQEIYNQIYALFKDNPMLVYYANTLDKTLEYLEHRNIAVIVADIIINGRDISKLIKILKKEKPLVMTIVVTKDVDSDAAIDLVNYGQVYRYLPKPVGDALLRMSINQALKTYQKNLERPELLQNYKVNFSDEDTSITLVQKIKEAVYF